MALNIYMTPDGNDSNNGLSIESPIATLSEAERVIQRETMATPQNVNVKIAYGVYENQRVQWSYFMEDHTIKFLPLVDMYQYRPVFRGDGYTWFNMRGSGKATNLHFRHIRVENYHTAISLSRCNSNTIDRCYFKKIGNVYDPDLPGSTACVRLVRCSDNEIKFNWFLDVINIAAYGNSLSDYPEKQKGCEPLGEFSETEQYELLADPNPSLLHAVYLAHHSQNNTIRGNVFRRVSGDPIRVRDYSNNNSIQDNKFEVSGVRAAVSDWFAWRNGASECPSYDNHVKDNTLNETFEGGTLVACYEFDRDTSGCGQLEPSRSRLICSNNMVKLADV